MPPPSLPPERAKVAEFYSASSGTIPPLPWQTFPPPFSSTSGHLDIFEREQETGYFYLKKPFTPSELLAVASMLLGANLSFPENQSIRLH